MITNLKGGWRLESGNIHPCLPEFTYFTLIAPSGHTMTGYMPQVELEEFVTSQDIRAKDPVPEAAKEPELTLADFVTGDLVLYVPYHVHGDEADPHCQFGVVSSVNDHYVFVKFEVGKTGFWTGPHATTPDTLLKRIAPPSVDTPVIATPPTMCTKSDFCTQEDGHQGPCSDDLPF